MAAFGQHLTVCRVDIKWFSEPNHSLVLNLTGQGPLSSFLHPNPFLPIPCLHSLLCLITPHTAYTELSFSCPVQVVSGLCICYPIFLNPGRYLLILPVARLPLIPVLPVCSLYTLVTTVVRTGIVPFPVYLLIRLCSLRQGPYLTCIPAPDV